MPLAFIASMFVLGLGTSLHCVSMCGPLVLTYAVKADSGRSWRQVLLPNALYQGAKITSYAGVGLLLGAVGSLFDVGTLRPYVMYIAGAFMVVLGLGMTGKVPWAARLTPRPPRALVGALASLRRRSCSAASADRGELATPVLFGLLTGVLPCGPLMAAQVSAAASASPVTGALGMAAFGLGTAPLMLAFGTAGSLIPRVLKQRMMTVLAIGVIVFGLAFINRGLMLTGSPVTLSTVKSLVLGGPQAASPDVRTGADGVAEVTLVIENVRFSPQTLRVPAGRPVRILVDRREDNPCSDQVAIPQLGVLVDVAPFAVTPIELPPTDSGSYTLTCGMGMMSGQLLVGSGAAAGPAGAWLAVLAVGVLGAYLALRHGRSSAAPAARDGRRDAARARVAGFTPTELVLVAGAAAAAVALGYLIGSAAG